MQSTRMSLLVGIVFLLLGLLGAATQLALARTIADDHFLYLPVVSYDLMAQIGGQVNVNGAAASGVTVHLMEDFDGNSATSVMTAITDAAGRYLLDGVPQLWEGHVYFVDFVNEDETPGLLAYWHTAKLNQLQPGNVVQFPAFDIGEVALVAPAAFAKVDFPEEFRWRKRAATPTDKYRLALKGSTYGGDRLV